MKKSFIISSLTALAAFCLCVTAQAQGPVVVSDKDDYAPGETALFRTIGFQPGELLDFSIAIGGDNGTWVPDIAWTQMPADNSGGAEVDYIVPETWANKTLQLTVMGLASGLTAQTTFTDSVDSLSLNSPTNAAPVHVTTAGGTITANVSYTTSCHGGGCGDNETKVHFSIDGNAANEFNNRANNASNVNYSVTVPAGLAVGCHSLTLQVVRQGQNDTTESCAIVVDAPTTPTPTPSATPTATPCLNHAPVITCLNPTPDLGSAIGCLGDNNSFTHDFQVAYSVDGQDTAAATVKATFTTSSGPVDAVVATVTDEDGDAVHVDLSNGTALVTIVGPGTGTAGFSVDIHADDHKDCNNVADSTCSGTASAKITYDFHGFFSPLSPVATTKVKQGSTVPAKFQIFDCAGTPITPNNIPGDTPSVVVTYVSGACPSGTPSVDDAGNSNGDTEFFRWDPTGMQWIFNLKTNSTYLVGKTYQISADLHDGNTNGALISIK